MKLAGMGLLFDSSIEKCFLVFTFARPTSITGSDRAIIGPLKSA
jgi:hypothetical protein